MSIIILISIAVTIIMVSVQAVIIFVSNIETTKRRIFLVLDFLGVFVIYSGLLVWLAIVMPLLVIPFVALFFIGYNVILFKVVKRFVLRARLVRIKEEINDALIESLRSLSELDYKGAYEILEDALKRYPESRELLNLKTMFDRKMKKAEPGAEIKLVK